MFVRHALPGERVAGRSDRRHRRRSSGPTRSRSSTPRRTGSHPLARTPVRADAAAVTGSTSALPAQRRLKSELVAEQLRRLARVDRRVEVEEVAGAPDGLGWRTRASFAVDGSGRIGFHRHRSHDIEPVRPLPDRHAGGGSGRCRHRRWRGARHVEVTASPDGGPPVLSVVSRGDWRAGSAIAGVGLVVNGRTVRPPDRSQFTAGRTALRRGPGVFWQVHPGAAALLTACVMDELQPGRASGPPTSTPAPASSRWLWPTPSDPGAGWWRWSATGCAWCRSRPQHGRSDQVETIRAVGRCQTVVGATLDGVDLVVLDPARRGAGQPVMRALASLDPPPRKVAYVSCDPASFARDLRVHARPRLVAGHPARVRSVSHDRARGAGGDPRAPRRLADPGRARSAARPAGARR